MGDHCTVYGLPRIDVELTLGAVNTFIGEL
jgi:hypothetical protein